MQLKNLKTKFIGKNVYYFSTIDSTQSYIWKIVNEAQNGTIVMADIQTYGKGTHGRIWYTDEKNNIAFSVLIKPNCNVGKLTGLTKKIAEIIINIFKYKYQIELQIKEPNDITYNSKKIGGILTETKLQLDTVKYLVVGIGINTNKTKFADEIKDIATSIKKEFNIKINTEEFVTEFCNEFEKEILKIMED